MLFSIALFTATSLFAQNITVTGKVTDTQNEPLIGVSILEEGTTNGTVTNYDGNFSIRVSANSTLIASYIGMTKQTISVNSRTTINIVMQDDIQMLQETVVIGYGSAKKQDLTGSIGSVNAEAIMRQPSLNAAQAVQGKISGVNVIASSAPGASPVVVIRGLGTALGGRNPLYIVDGFPVDNIQSLSPSDIVTMDVLKDASSASIYGIRAANGVIMITTKKGKEGNSKVTVDSHVGIKTVLNKVKMANASEFITYFNEGQRASNSTEFLSTDQPFDTDWYDEVLNTGFFNNNTVSLSGGGRTVDYFFSYNYYNEKGVLDDQGYNRSTIRNNNVYKFLEDRLKFTQNLNISFSNDHPKPYGAFNEAYRQTPITPAYYSTGRYGVPFYNQNTMKMWNNDSEPGDVIAELTSIGNPLLNIHNAEEKTKTLTLQGGIEGEFIVTDYLKVNSRFGATKYYSKNRLFNDLRKKYLNSGDPISHTEEEFDKQKEANPNQDVWANNSLRLEDIETYRWLWEGYITFNKSFGSHNVDAVVGMSRERTGIGSRTFLKGFDVPAKKQYWNMAFASDAYAKQINQYSYTSRSLASYFARAQYNFNYKYYVTGTIRRDGSSAFKDSGDRWGTFPSFGLGWNISEEDFMQGIEFLDFLKIRGTWGKLGNQDVPVNVSQIMTDPLNTNYNYSFGNPAGYYQGAAFGTPATGLSWEVTRETSVGFDFSMFDQRLNGGFDYYDKMNTNTILIVNPIMNSPYGEKYYSHGAKVNNRGFEINLSWGDALASGFKYEVGVNYSYNKNRVKEVKPAHDGDTGGSLANGQITKRLMVDRPIYSWWMYQADGVWQTQEEIDANTRLGTPDPGHLRYKDQNDDGVIDDRDKVYAGSYLPTSTYGIHVNLEYMNFDFSIDGYGVAGNKIYNGIKNTRINGAENIAKDTFKERWTGPGSTNKHPGANRDAIASTYYLESGAYFRINNITLGYTFKDLISKGTNLRLYATAQNPFMFTGYSGFTPEITGSGLPTETSGIEIDAYPTTRNFLFGINVQF